MSKRKETWNSLDTRALALRVLESQKEEMTAEACGVIFWFRKVERDFNAALRYGVGKHWIMSDARYANGRRSKAKDLAIVMVKASLASEQGEDR